ncbi:PadR family transcriptional regulator [Aeromicrobium camelliae]|uniref:PadR family transcriptional regulator n=1 Tax=Aeromicrobium camelliae TaxID=1538144 RepID=A0A3N6ZQV1_9ACTN|nr:PadR family transcriptional regulator [Aeromicrobium camelliae]
MSRRRGVALELAVLGLLADSPMHGYELRKQVNGLLGWTRLLSYGTLYPCLKTLGRQGYIVADEDVDSGRRAKITYRLTAEGKEHLAELLSDTGPSAWDDENFGVRFAFFSRTTSPIRVRILEGRRSRLEERLDNVKNAALRGRDRMDSYTRELQRHGLESVEREITWLTELIERERAAADTAPGATTPPSGAATTSADEADRGQRPKKRTSTTRKKK